MAELAEPVAGQGEHRDAPRAEGAEDGGDELERARQVEEDPVARAAAPGEQRGGGGVRVADEGGVGPGAVAVDDGGGVRGAGRAVPDEGVERGVGVVTGEDVGVGREVRGERAPGESGGEVLGGVVVAHPV